MNSHYEEISHIRHFSVSYHFPPYRRLHGSALKEPTVTVSDIAFSDLSLKTMIVNTTVTIYNPNPAGAKLTKVAFDVFYLDDTQELPGSW
jgi:hypothetical protein